jgi:hypothetical protein
LSTARWISVPATRASAFWRPAARNGLTRSIISAPIGSTLSSLRFSAAYSAPDCRICWLASTWARIASLRPFSYLVGGVELGAETGKVDDVLAERPQRLRQLGESIDALHAAAAGLRDDPQPARLRHHLGPQRLRRRSPEPAG